MQKNRNGQKNIWVVIFILNGAEFEREEQDEECMRNVNFAKNKTFIFNKIVCLKLANAFSYVKPKNVYLFIFILNYFTI